MHYSETLRRTCRAGAGLLAIFAIITAFIFAFQDQAFGQLSINYLTSFPTSSGDPIRIASDSTGLLYVAAPASGKILKFSQDGSFTGALNGFKKPLSVAVDNAGNVYVGDFKDGSVSVVNAGASTPSFSLGQGKGEFGMAGDIAVGPNGLVYVTDSTNNLVKVYSAAGAFSFSFGGAGINPGQMMFPTGIAIDEAAQEVYVVDHNNGRVQVFDLNGAFKRTFGSFGSGQGRLTRPHGIAVANGNVYVADAYQSTVEVFTTAGTFVSFVGQYGTGPGGLKVPMDVSMKGTKLFVSNTDNQRIEVFDVLDSQGLTVTPSALSFSTYVGANPAAQTVKVDSVAGAPVAWTASVASPFTVNLSPTSGTTPSTVTVGVDVAGIGAGTYSGKVNFRANGIDYPLTLNLTVLPPLQELFVSPSSVDLFHQKEGGLASKALSVTSTGGGLQWTATEAAEWLDVSPSTGSTPGTATVSLNQNADSLAEGIYTTSVTVSAPNAAGGPVSIPVSLKVVVAGTITVTTNLDEATFSITGPETYSGTGMSWQTEEARPGTYTIRFGHVKGYRRPATRTFDVKTGKTVTIDVRYQQLEVANIFAAAKGAGPNNDALIRVLDFTGKPVSEFKAFTTKNGSGTKYGAVVAAADIDDDGTSEIIAALGPGADNQAAVKVFRQDGTLLSSAGPVDNTKYGANIAAGDIFGDGRHQVAMSMTTSSRSQAVTIYEFDGYNLVEKAKVNISNKSDYPAKLAFGDVDGDGMLELIVSKLGEVSIYVFNETLSPTLFTTGSVAVPNGKNGTYNSQMSVSAGDIDGDGLDEIILGYDNGVDSYAGFYDEALKAYGSAVKVFAKGRSAPSLSAMDWNGDGVSEVLAGKGANQDNDTAVRVYGSGGTMLKEIRAFDASVKYGVNAAFGVKK